MNTQELFAGYHHLSSEWDSEDHYLRENVGKHKANYYCHNKDMFQLISDNGEEVKPEIDINSCVQFRDSSDETTTYQGMSSILKTIVPGENQDKDGNNKVPMVFFDENQNAETRTWVIKPIKNVDYIKDNALIYFIDYNPPGMQIIKIGVIVGHIDIKGMWRGYMGLSGYISSGGQPHKIDTGILNNIATMFEQNSTVVDFGCGNADYIKHLITLGFKCEAYDGNPNTPQMTDGIAKVQDLTVDFDLGKQFDYVINLEVAEHIPKKYEKIYINNVVKHTGKYLIMSWAKIGQGGDGHVNCQNHDYVIDVFNKHGMVYQEEASLALRSVAELDWFKETIFIFSKG